MNYLEGVILLQSTVVHIRNTPYCPDSFMCHGSDTEGEADLIEHLVSVFIAVELVSQCEYTHFLCLVKP